MTPLLPQVKKKRKGHKKFPHLQLFLCLGNLCLLISTDFCTGLYTGIGIGLCAEPSDRLGTGASPPHLYQLMVPGSLSEAPAAPYSLV